MKRIFFLTSFLLTVSVVSIAQLHNNGANVRLTTGSFIVLQDMHFNNNGTFVQSAGSVKMIGAANNYILGSTSPQFFTLIIAKNETKQVLLSTPINIAGELLFNSGLLHLNRKNIILLGTAIVKGEAENRHIIGPAGGYIEIRALLNAPLNSNPGNLGAWITSARNLGTTIVRRSHQPQGLGGGAPASIARHYEIIPAFNTNLNATLRLSYLDAELNGLNESNLVVYTKNNASPWINQGYTQRTSTRNFILKNGVAYLHRSTLGIPASTLRGAGIIDPNDEQTTRTSNGITKTPRALFIEQVYPTIGTMKNIFIRTGNMTIRNIQVNIFDMKGKLIFTREARYASQWIELPALLPAGTYQLVVRSGEFIYQQRFVKQQ